MKFFKSLIAIGLILVTCLSVFVIICYKEVVSTPLSIKEQKNTIILDKYGNIYQELGHSICIEFPEVVQNAVISVEDKRFNTHSGVDFKRLVKVSLDTLTNGKLAAGGSTITQQLVKNLTGNSEKTIKRKAKEAIYALALEQNESKQNILNRYLNSIYLGKGSYGVKDAANCFWNKSVSEITLAEAAFIAAIIKAPEVYLGDLEKANSRKNYVLQCMKEQNYISEKDCNKYSKVFVTVGNYKGNKKYNWATESVIRSLALKMQTLHKIPMAEAEAKIINGGYTIYSTIDPQVQKKLEDTFKKTTFPEGLQSGMVVLDTDGMVNAIYGGIEQKIAFGFNRALQARRQPGSAIKPLAVYAPAIEENRVNALSIYTDEPLNINGFTVKNYDGTFSGNISIRNAIKDSCNTVAVQVLNELGPKKGISYLKKMGFKTEAKDCSLALALGAVSVGYTPLEMASGFQTIQNAGVWCEPVLFTKVVDRIGKTFSFSQQKERVFSEETAYITTNMLQTVVISGTAQTLSLSGVEVAAKTGTTSDNKDKWLCAYTPSYVVCSWFGYDIPKPMALKNIVIHGITKEIIRSLNSNKTFAVPTNIAHIEVCNISNEIANNNCKDIRIEVFDTSKDLPETCSICTSFEDVIEQANERFEQGADYIFSALKNLFGYQNSQNAEEYTTYDDYYEYDSYEAEELSSTTEYYEADVVEEEYF